MPDDEPKKSPDQPGESPKTESAQPATGEAAQPVLASEATPGAGETETEGDEGDAEQGSEEDRFRPEAIAARVAGLGEETEVERVARQEEEKLRERRKGKKGKKGLESAASKRLAKIGEAKVKRPAAPGTYTPDADPLIERTARLRKWIQQNQQTFGALVAVVVFAAAGFLGWTYWQNKREANASALLAQGIAAERGQVSDKSDEDDDDTNARTSPLYPTFKTEAEKRDSALSKYREVESKYPGTGAAILARLAEGGLLLDSGDAKGAASAYEDVKSSPLAQVDMQVKGRAFEGLGFAYEEEARSDAAGRDKHLDDALAAFKQLETIDAKGFKELGKYHEARVEQAKGDRDKAVALLKEVHAAINEQGESHPFAYLDDRVDDMLRQLDPTALPPKPSPKMGGIPGMGGQGPGGIDMSDPQIQELIRQMQQQQQKGGMPGAPPGAPRPAGLPPGAPPPMPLPAPKPPVPSP